MGRKKKLNNNSIGIEIVNLGYKNSSNGRQWYPFSDYQIDIIIELAHNIILRYGIKPKNVIGHSDISPGRKFDPGPLFPWKKLFEKGIGAWYNKNRVQKIKNELEDQQINILSLQKDFKRYGYEIEETGIFDKQTKNVIYAFQMHFRPENFSGNIDIETIAILKNLLEKYVYN